MCNILNRGPAFEWNDRLMSLDLGANQNIPLIQIDDSNKAKRHMTNRDAFGLPLALDDDACLPACLLGSPG